MAGQGHAAGTTGRSGAPRFGDALVAAVRRAKRLRQRLRVRGRPHAVALMYHRIAAPTADPWDLSVSPAHFAEHLQVLRGWAACRGFGDLAASLDASDRPHRMAAITFDDGYRDNLANALPLLEAAGTPATVFVLSGVIGARRAFWWDALTRVFLETAELPETLALETARGPRVWLLGEAARCGGAEMAVLARARLPFDARRHPRIALLAEVREVLFRAGADEAARMAEALLDWAGLDRAGAPLDQPMTEAELSRLSASGLVEIGAHTVTHRPLDLLPPAEALAELAGSRAALREVVGREIATVAYPYGRFGPETPRLAAEAGFAAACTTVEWVAVGATDPYRFPRIMARDWDGDAFARVLRQFAGA
jgi:peptidoglycan/xylan/chitin deacetylase (PgdA/CDA1 family)